MAPPKAAGILANFNTSFGRTREKLIDLTATAPEWERHAWPDRRNGRDRNA
jgi:hypothetical protein